MSGQFKGLNTAIYSQKLGVWTPQGTHTHTHTQPEVRGLDTTGYTHTHTHTHTHTQPEVRGMDTTGLVVRMLSEVSHYRTTGVGNSQTNFKMSRLLPRQGKS